MTGFAPWWMFALAGWPLATVPVGIAVGRILRSPVPASGERRG